MSVSNESSQIFTCDGRKGGKPSLIDVTNKMRYPGIKALTALAKDVAYYVGLVDDLE